MATATVAPTTLKTVNTTLNYYLDPSIGGHTQYQIGVVDYFRRKFDTHEVEVNDVRGREDQFEINTHGFQFAKHTSKEKEFVDDSQVKRVAYPEVEDLIKNM